MRRNTALALALPLVIASAIVACGGDDDPIEATSNADAGAGEDGGGSSATDSGSDPGPGDSGAAADADAAPAPLATRVVAYAFSDQATPVAPYAPAANRSFNAGGGAISIAKEVTTGNYTVTFTGLDLAANGVALVTAFGGSGHCSWGGTTGSAVAVRCFDSAGSNADTKFSVTVFAEGSASSASILGFAHANDMASASYTPQATRSNNAVGGGAITATRSGAGVYKIDFGGLATGDIENIQVMPYGSGKRCSISGVTDSAVDVSCYVGGIAADAQYTILVLGKKPGATTKVRAFALADQSAAATYAPTLAFTENDGGVTASRSGNGTYSIDFAGMNLNAGAHVQVSANVQGRRCNVTAWAGTTVNLDCVNSAEIPQNNNYGIVVIQ